MVDNSDTEDYRKHHDIFDTIEYDESRTSIIKDKELLSIDYVPEGDRIVGRNDEIENIAQEVYYSTRAEPASNILIYGKTGTGKSLVSKFVCSQAPKRARNNGYDLAYIYIDCSKHDTHTRVTREIALRLEDKVEEEYDIPLSGIGSSEYYRYIWGILEKFDSLLLILDEIDKLDNDDVLMQLSRARETGDTDCHIQIIGISNKIEYKEEQLTQRVLSSLGDTEFVFPPYDANQLRDILERRKDAFEEGVIQNDVIPVTAALSAKEHGDARKAIEILRNAGEIAERRGDTKLTEEHVREAQDRAEMDRLRELIDGSTTHSKLALLSLAVLHEYSENNHFLTGEIYNKYKEFAKEVGTDPLSERRVYSLLKEQVFLGVVESEKTSGGRSSGVYMHHRLIIDPEIVISVITENQQLQELVRKI